jgi:AcrR family transcriptional regulator
MKSSSKLAAGRRDGLHQVDEQRKRILEAAERLFLQNGLDNTRMLDIAAAAGLTKMSLYRYFPNRDVIALEIQKRMLERIAAQLPEGAWNDTPGALRQLVHVMIRDFTRLRDAYRYIGMFDHTYLDNPPENPLTQWTKQGLLDFSTLRAAQAGAELYPDQYNRLLMAFSTVIWFLEKLALRGELTWSDQSIPLETHLHLFEEMILGYIDRTLPPENS